MNYVFYSWCDFLKSHQPPSKWFPDKYFERSHCACPILLLQCHSLLLSLHFDFEFQDFDLEIWNFDLDTGCDVDDVADLKLGVEFPEKRKVFLFKRVQVTKSNDSIFSFHIKLVITVFPHIVAAATILFWIHQVFISLI